MRQAIYSIDSIKRKSVSITTAHFRLMIIVTRKICLPDLSLTILLVIFKACASFQREFFSKIHSLLNNESVSFRFALNRHLNPPLHRTFEYNGNKVERKSTRPG